MARLAICAGALSLLAGLIPATAAWAAPAPLPGSSAGQSGGSWYCFGHKATITQPDQFISNETNKPPRAYYNGTPGPDVIVTAGGDGPAANDWVAATPGDVVCTLGGDDIVFATYDGNPKKTTTVDLGSGDDTFVSYDRCSGARWSGGPPGCDSVPRDGDGYPVPRHNGTRMVVFGGPGNDQLHGGPGADHLHSDRGFTYIDADDGDGNSAVIDQCWTTPGAEQWLHLGCDTNHADIAYVAHATFKPSYGSWSLVCPGEPSKTATWYVSSTGYGATNPCQRWLVFSYLGPYSGPTGTIAYHVTPGTKFVRKGFTPAQDGYYRGIGFDLDPDAAHPCNDFGGVYITHADGTVTSAPGCD